jgi:hypothetical protein
MYRITEPRRQSPMEQRRSVSDPDCHAAVNAAIADLLNWSREVEQLGTPRLNELGARLRRLRCLVAVHFAEEEEQGLLERAAANGPALVREAAALLGEHGEFLDRLDALSQSLCCVEPQIDRWSVAIEAVQQVLADMQAHEARETQLMQTAVSGSRPESG